ncbi:hypothetical protein BDW22DRAFT_1425006 [Trametopsis cervina]|nr:hypothetical protein BDW22DRAFT_1425006 [Trametopsis cervina]
MTTRRKSEPPAPKSPRRAPHCKTCGRPRLGHPRAGCPVADDRRSSSPSKDMQDVESELKSLHIEDDIDNTATPATTRRRRRSSGQTLHIPQPTLSSLSSGAHEVLRGLQRPGIFDDSDTDKGDVEGKDMEDEGFHEERTTNRVEKLKSPRTSHAPNTSPKIPTSTRASSSRNPIPKSSPRRSSQAVTDAEQRGFLDHLDKRAYTAPALVYVVAAEEIKAAAEEAEVKGFQARAYVPSGQSKPEQRGFLVLGQDGQAVDVLMKRVEREDRKGSSLGNYLASAVLGAVATWTTLSW